MRTIILFPILIHLTMFQHKQNTRKTYTIRQYFVNYEILDKTDSVCFSLCVTFTEGRISSFRRLNSLCSTLHLVAFE